MIAAFQIYIKMKTDEDGITKHITTLVIDDVAGAFAVIAAFQIYIKMNTGEDGITKHILTLVGACLFIIGATIVFPAFFGYRI